MDKQLKLFACGGGLVLAVVALNAFTQPAYEEYINPEMQYIALPGQKVILADVVTGRGDRSGRTIWAFNFAEDVNVQPIIAPTQVVVGFGQPAFRAGDMTIYQPDVEYQIRLPDKAIGPLQLLYGLPDLDNRPGTFEDQRDTAVQVTLDLAPQIYAYPSEMKWGRPLSFEEEAAYLAEFECMVDQDIAPGITRLREPTDAEAAGILAAHSDRGPRYKTRDGCIDMHAVAGASYVVADADGTLIGYGTCQSYRVTDVGRCLFQFWLPQEKIVEYRFSAAFLPQLRAIDDFVRAELRAATIADLSQNIGQL